MPPTSATAPAPAAKGSAPPPAPEPFFDASTFRPEAGMLWLLRRAQLAIGQLVSEATELGGSATMPQWVPLYKIHCGEANTVADLARRCTLDAGSMTRLLDRMEARGLCRRVRSESDRRVVHIELTDEGKTAAEQMSGTLCRIYNAVLANFTPGEWTQLRALLARVADQAEGLHGRGVAAWGAPS